MTQQESRSKPDFRPHVAGLILLVIVGIFSLDLFLRSPDLPEIDGRHGDQQAVNSPPDVHNQIPRQTAPQFVEVIDVPDGDSLVVMLNGKSTRVRLQGVDCPERDQAFGDEARQLSTRLVRGKTVKLIEHGTDQYGRVLANVTLADGSDLGAALVQAGLAWQYRRHNQDAALRRLEQQARSAGRGLWSEKNPTPPWQWRRDHPRQ